VTASPRVLEIRTSPHIASGNRVDTIMFNVVLALVPASAFAVYVFGLAALLTLVVAVGSCVVTEHLACRLRGARSTVGDWSVVITGLLYGLTLPPALPLWMTAVGGVLCVALGKSLFGGLGQNPFNPALVGRAFLQAAFPTALTSWVPAFASTRFEALPASTLAPPFLRPEAYAYLVDGEVDVVTAATPLAAWKFDHVAATTQDLALGLVTGSTGETSSLLLLAGGLYLIARNMMSWRIPVALLGTVAVLSSLLYAIDPSTYASPLFMLFAGGLMLGAMFMATDMVGSPMTPLGQVLYAVLIGALVVVIRTWGGMPEGVMYAILLGNAATPLIDRALPTRPYGAAPRRVAL
jgi:electron transport complex protein RnfD